MSELSNRQKAIVKRAIGSPVVFEGNRLLFDGRTAAATDGVIRFLEDEGYNRNFALQWKKFQLEQYDRVNKSTLYFDRLHKQTGWPTTGLNGELVLEAGCGAGAFTCHLVATGADLVSFDYSSAVDVSAMHNSGDRAVFAQADIMDMPFQSASFDRVFCFGVLQHTPDPAEAFRQLHKMVRPGGRIAVDIYQKDRKIRSWKAKYLWRPLTVRMDHDRLMRILEWFIPKWLPFDTVIKRIPLFGRYLGSIIPCMNYMWLDISPEERVRWSIMNTFDALAPTYDTPVRTEDVRRWFLDCGYSEFEVHASDGLVVGNGLRRV